MATLCPPGRPAAVPVCALCGDQGGDPLVPDPGAGCSASTGSVPLPGTPRSSAVCPSIPLSLQKVVFQAKNQPVHSPGPLARDASGGR